MPDQPSPETKYSSPISGVLVLGLTRLQCRMVDLVGVVGGKSMNPETVFAEFERHGRLSRRSVDELRQLVSSPDPYRAITVVADTGCFELAKEVGSHLSSLDVMVRWNAAATLFTRFRDKRFIFECMEMAQHDDNAMVRTVSIVGLGELLPFIEEERVRSRCARILLSVFRSAETWAECRKAGYEGILAAMDVLPLDRPPVSRAMRIPEDVDEKMVDAFVEQYAT